MILLHFLRTRLVKVVITLVIGLMLFQYFYNGIIESRSVLEPLFIFNSSRHHRSSVESNLTSGNNMTNNTATAATMWSSDNTSQIAIVINNVLVNSSELKNLTLCPPIPPNLEGPVKLIKDSRPIQEIEQTYSYLDLGGQYDPHDCKARYKVAIIIPYRDRAAHLSVFLNNIHSMLKKQQIHYGIYVVEQAGTNQFNRGMLMNIGFVEASKLDSYDCFVFHDVDLLPEDDRNLYTCPEQPRHMSVAVNVFNYRLPYKDIFGGVSAITRDQFIKVNGFSNLFWGWGGEDDDMSSRVRRVGYHISRYPPNIARYTMLSHRKEKPNPKRYDILHSGQKRYKSDGLNSLKYKRIDLQMKKLYTWVLVELTQVS